MGGWRQPDERFAVPWDAVTVDAVEALREVIDTAEDERPVQQFLAEHPECLVERLVFGHGRWVIPKARLGIHHVTDFLVAEDGSLGIRWHAIELESPARRMFTSTGDFTR